MINHVYYNENNNYNDSIPNNTAGVLLRGGGEEPDPHRAGPRHIVYMLYDVYKL